MRQKSPIGAEVSPLTLSWPQQTTPLEAIERALYALAEEVTGVVASSDGSWDAEFHPRSTSADPTTLTHRIRQEVTDQTLRLRIAERTDPIRNLVFAMAFSRSGLAPGGNAEAARS
jgi:His-Xaa-Ser system protein HxsD